MTDPDIDAHRSISAEEGSQPAPSSPQEALRALTRRLNERTPPLALALQGESEGSMPSYPEMAVLPYFQQTWAALRLDGQMRRSLQYVAENAGPLNSRNLVHRALSLMQGTAPGYLQHLLAYVDELSNLTAIAPAAQNDSAVSSASSSGPARKSTKSPKTSSTAAKTPAKRTNRR